MERSGAALTDHIIDVGGGASTLVDDLLDRGYQNLTVLDISSKAIDMSKARLGNSSELVNWIVEDVFIGQGVHLTSHPRPLSQTRGGRG
jgi:2-polyprenyl-3-methyl-5-hydroxy-6-metoxy-1,4-benzoquinol methylase